MDDTVTDDPRTLARWLLERAKNVIVFDGTHGAGKTTLVREIAKLLPRSTSIDVDEFLNRGQDAFVDAIRFDELHKTLLGATEKNVFILIATVCAREVVKRVGIPEPIYVYVRKDDDANSSEALAEQYGEIESSHSFQREIEEYHRDYWPRQNADFCYIRKEIER